MATVKTGIVLEGGGMRGMYTCGILDVLMEHRIYTGAMVGVSAGIALGCNYKSHQPGRALRYNKRFARDMRYSGLRSLLLTGNYYNADFAFHKVPSHYDIFDGNTFENSPMECYAVCFDALKGETVYHRLDRVDYDSLEWIRASSSMPVAARPVEIGGSLLLDGGLGDSIPLQFMMDQGYRRNVVILTREHGYRKGRNRSLWMMKPLLHRYPKVIEALRQRPEKYNGQLKLVEKEERDGNAFVFRPLKPLNISRTCHDPQEYDRVYQQGRTEATQRLDDLVKFLNKEEPTPSS